MLENQAVEDILDGMIIIWGILETANHSTRCSGITTNCTYSFYEGEDLICQLDKGTQVQSPESYTSKHLLLDHLGTTRAELTFNASNQPVVNKFYDYMPYGEEIAPAAITEQIKFTGKQRDSESNLDYFNARYYGSSLLRFDSPDPELIQKKMFADPQNWNIYMYVRNNPLRFVDPTGKWVELKGNETERKAMLTAIQTAAGKAGQYFYKEAGKKTGKHYLKIYEKGADGKSTDFSTVASKNAVANKLAGIIRDTKRELTMELVKPGTRIGNVTIGSLTYGHTPGATSAMSNLNPSRIFLTSGSLGEIPKFLMSDNKAHPTNLGEVIMHEIGHVDSAWYHNTLGDLDSNGDAVRIENQARFNMGYKTYRVGHTRRGDVNLDGSMPF